MIVRFPRSRVCCFLDFMRLCLIVLLSIVVPLPELDCCFDQVTVISFGFVDIVSSMVIVC